MIQNTSVGCSKNPIRRVFVSQTSHGDMVSINCVDKIAPRHAITITIWLCHLVLGRFDCLPKYPPQRSSVCGRKHCLSVRHVCVGQTNFTRLTTGDAHGPTTMNMFVVSGYQSWLYQRTALDTYSGQWYLIQVAGKWAAKIRCYANIVRPKNNSSKEGHVNVCALSLVL